MAKVPPHETIGDRIQRVARERGLPGGSALATMLGVSYETLRKWTVGTNAIRRDRLETVASILGVSAAYLYTGEGDAASEGVAESPNMTRVVVSCSLRPALRRVSRVLAAVPADIRGEVGDLMRTWASYGGRSVYADALGQLLSDHDMGDDDDMEGGPGLSAQAVRLAYVFDRLTPSDRARIYSMAAAAAPATKPSGD